MIYTNFRAAWNVFCSNFYFELWKIIKNMRSKVKHGLALSECNLIKNFKLPWKIWILVHFKCKNLTWSIHTSRGNFSTIAKLGIKMSRIFVPCFLKIQNFRVTASRTAKRICGEAYQYRKKAAQIQYSNKILAEKIVLGNFR